MTLDSLIMLVGAFVAVLPFLGLPNRWDSILFLIAGVLVIMFGIVVRRRGHGTKSSAQASFVETRTHAEQVGHEIQ